MTWLITTTICLFLLVAAGCGGEVGDSASQKLTPATALATPLAADSRLGARAPTNSPAVAGEGIAATAALGEQPLIEITESSVDWVPLHVAARDGLLKVAGQLIAEGADVNARESQTGATPLHLAAHEGHVALIDLLLAKGADREARDGDGFTPLALAALAGQTGTAERLLAAKADPNARLALTAAPGAGALHLAAGQGHAALVSQLIKAGAVVDGRDDGGATPLFYAAKENRTEAARTLLDAGADLTVATRKGATPLHAAAIAGALKDDATGAGAAGMVRLLLERGAPVDPRGDGGRTPLFLAAAVGNLAAARLLIGQGADVNAAAQVAPGKTITPLAAARAQGHAALADLLREKGGRE